MASKKIETDLTMDDLFANDLGEEMSDGDTIAELMARHGWGDMRVRRLMKKKLAEGKVEQGWKYAPCGTSGSMRPLLAYRVKS